MHLSHSGLQLLLTCPASYYLSKKQGISKKEESAALSIGSAFHWGMEHNTADLGPFLDELSTYQKHNYDYEKDVAIASGMVAGYLKHKDKIFEQVLTGYDGEKLEVLDEQHELDLTEYLPSFQFEKPHEFHGIIDLLLLTPKGWIILDYKTSSQTPDWDKYLDQVLRYCWLLREEFPDVPVYKVGIINVRKVKLRQKEKEATDNFINRIKREYDLNDNELIVYHEFEPSDFTEDKMNAYITNLSRMCDFAQTVDDNHYWFINFGNAVSVYGKSEFWDIFYNVPDCEHLYKIYDPMYNEDFGECCDYRDCLKIDLESLYYKVMNHYKDFEKEALTCFNEFPEAFSKDTVFEKIKNTYKTDDKLLEYYWEEFERQLVKKEEDTNDNI